MSIRQVDEGICDMIRAFQPEMEARKKRLLDFWSGKDIGRPPLSFIPDNLSPRQMYNDPDGQLERMVKYFRAISAMPGDYIPVFRPDQGTIALPSVFGGELIKESEGGKQWIKPVILDIESIPDMPAPIVLSGQVKEEFDRCRRWRDITGGLGYVAPPDMQGPVGIASMLMDTTEFFTGMYTHPDIIRRLLRLCADLILGVLDAYRKEFGACFIPVTWPNVWFPDGMGVTLTQDSIPLLSPAMYRDFELPLAQEISQANGGVYIHCCGDSEHMLPELAAVPNLIGFDHAYPHCHTKKAIEVLGIQTVMTCGVSSRGAEEFPAYDGFIKYLQPTLPVGARMWYVLPADNPGLTTNILDILGLADVRTDYESALKKI
jgi:hypothetical protein